jgi:hypothetical protein
MTILDAIEAYNRTSAAPIQLRPTRDGRVTAILPLTGAEALVVGSQFKEDVRVTARDVALVCREARAAMVPALSLLEASLAALPEGPPKD